MISTARKENLQGRKPLSHWDEVNKTWREDGGDQIIKELEEAYATAQDEIAS